MLEQPTIISETKGAIRYLTLNRPGKRIAIENQMVDELRGALTVAEADAETRVIVLVAQARTSAQGWTSHALRLSQARQSSRTATTPRSSAHSSRLSGSCANR
jgi:enoyl-CoA hydratase/carnithine racemase